MQLYETHFGNGMPYQHVMLFILCRLCLIGSLTPACNHHAVAQGLFQHCHSYRGHFHAE